MDEDITTNEVVKPKKDWIKYLFLAFYVIIFIALLLVRNAVIEQKQAFTDDPCGFCDKHCHKIEFGNDYASNLNNQINETSFESMITRQDEKEKDFR